MYSCIWAVSLFLKIECCSKLKQDTNLTLAQNLIKMFTKNNKPNQIVHYTRHITPNL